MHRSPVRKYTILAAKLVLASALLGYLFYQARQNQNFSSLAAQPKQWGLLAAALVCCFGFVILTFLRWMLLVRALGLPFRVTDALRLGFLGYLLNFVSAGSVGGDLFKAVFIAREQHGRRTEAVATVVIDRLFGLYGLFVVASGAILFGGEQGLANVEVVQVIKKTTLISTAVGAVVILLLLIPGFTGGRVTRLLNRVPGIGHTLVRLIEAIRIYRAKYPVLLLAMVMSLGVHSLLAVTLYCIARGLGGAYPTFAEHLLIAPIAALAGAMPIAPAGLGAFELTLNELYKTVSNVPGIAVTYGFIVALGYRVVTVLVALPGVYYFLSGRREVMEVIHEAEEEAEEEETDRATETDA